MGTSPTGQAGKEPTKGFVMPAAAKAIAHPNPAWGSEGTSSKDLIIAKIKLAQASSNNVKEGNAKPGQIVHSLTGALMADKGGKLDVLPILCVGYWMISALPIGKPGQKVRPKFLRKELLTEQNDNDDWKIETFDHGDPNQPVIREKCLSFMVLLADRIHSFPLFLDFMRTSKRSGMVLSTIIQENKLLGKPAPARVVELSTQLQSRGDDSWFVFSVAAKRDAKAEEIAACKQWYDKFQAKHTKIEVAPDEEDNGVA